MLTRRQLLGGTLGLAGAAAVGVAVPGVRHRVRELVDPVPEPSHPVPSGPVGTLVSGSFRSAAMGAVTGFGIAYPERARPGLPLLLVLHGRGNSHESVFGSHRLGPYLSQVVRGGVPPFAVVGVDGGNDSYWHPRKTGQDPQRMVLEELLPVLRARGLRTDRFAVGGWSMGGYGAILLAERLGSARVAALVPDSPALWERWQDSAGGAFDGRADFEAHDVLHHLEPLRGVPVRVTCGTSDPFLPGVRAFLRGLPGAERELSAGGHDVAWWQHVAPQQLEFAGRRLALG